MENVDRKYFEGGDYMIPFCRDEILSRFAGIPAL